MFHYRYDHHSMFCRENNYCENYTRSHFVFFYENDFHLVTMFNCCGNLYEKCEILDILIGKSKRTRFDYGKSMIADRKKRLFDLIMSNRHYEYHFFYEDNASKEYCYQSTYPFIDKYFNRSEIQDNRIRAIEYIEKLGIQNTINKDRQEYLFEEIDTLCYRNMVPEFEPLKVINTIDELISEINKNKHGNDKKSNNKRTLIPRIQHNAIIKS